MAYDPYGYQDPNAFLDPYGGYDQYGYGQEIDDSPPPPPSKDWVDIPKVNRAYVSKIPRSILHEDFKHLKQDKLYVIEMFLEYLELNNEVLENHDSKENVEDNLEINLKLLHYPPLKIDGFGKKGEEGSTHFSVRSGPQDWPPMSEWFQHLFSSVANIVAESAEIESLAEVEEGEEGEEEEGEEEREYEKKPSVLQEQQEIAEEEPKNVTRIEVMKGKSVLLPITGISLIQMLQQPCLTVSVDRSEIVEEDETLVTIGSSFMRFPQQFPQAVMRSDAAMAEFTAQLEGGEGETVGEVGLKATIVCLDCGLETNIAETPQVYEGVKLVSCFESKSVEEQPDPALHPRLAVTLLNLEPPLNLCRTSTEIIQNALDTKLITPDSEHSAFFSRFNPRPCRWLEIAKESCDRSKSSLHSKCSTYSDLSSPCRSPVKDRGEGSKFPCDVFEMEEELCMLWGKLRRQCKEVLEPTEEPENKLKSLYDDLEELLNQDKPEDWDYKSTSEKSETSVEEDKKSKTSERSSKRGTLKSSS